MDPGSRSKTHALRAASLAGALAAALALASPAAAADYVVNNTGDGSDANTADTTCEVTAATGDCTLRAAVEEANADVAADNISFDATTFNTSPKQTIAIGSVITIGGTVSIDGCSFAPNSAGPCVGVRAPDLTTDALNISGVTANVALRGLAITNADQALFYGGSATGLQVQNCWFGIKVDGTNEKNDVAIDLIGNGATIGGPAGASGTAPADRNVIANSAGAGTDAAVQVGGDNNQILGNYFGVASNGTTSAANDDSIEVSGTTAGGPATGTTIGGTLSNAELQTPACDGPCNVIANGLEEGVDLQGDGIASSPPAGQTTIAGNFVGLRPDGITAAGNATNGVEVGDASDVTVGGATANQRNVIGANSDRGIGSGAGASNLLVRNNFIGLNSLGTVAIPDQVRGATIQGGTFADNRLGGSPTNPSDHGLSLDGVNVVTGNFFGVGTGSENLGLPGVAIRVQSDGNMIGGDTGAEANTIDNTRGASSNAILVTGGASAISGNNLSSNEGAGIMVDNAASGNVIGGDTAGEENVISDSGEDAIRISNGTNNLIDRNRGTGNGTDPSDDIFIDLNDNGPGNSAGGPNGAVEAPPIDSATTTSATGTTAEPNAVVRVFRQDVSDPGRVDAFVGMTSADGAGDWQLVFPAAQPGGSFLVATQTRFGTQNTSELSATRLVPAPPAAASGGGDGTTTGGSGGSTGTGSSFLPGAIVLPAISARQTALSRDLAELAAALRKLGIDGLLKKKGATIDADSLLGGTLELEALIDGLRVAATAKVLSGKRTFSAAGKAKLTVKLTREGRRILARRRRARLRLRGTFTDTAKAAAISSARVTVARKKRKRR